MAKKHLSERPWWKLFVQIMTIVTGVSAAILAGIAVWVGINQLKEMQKRPFLSLAFSYYDITTRQPKYRYSWFAPRHYLTREDKFLLSIINTGSKSSRGGKVFLGVPQWLEAELKSFRGEVIRRPDKDSLFGGSVVYEIPFDNILSPQDYVKPTEGKKNAMVSALAWIKLSMPDTARGHSLRVNGKPRWPLVYKIEAEDDECVYQIRWISVYFGILDSARVDSLIQEDWESNLFNKRFRPKVKFIIERVEIPLE